MGGGFGLGLEMGYGLGLRLGWELRLGSLDLLLASQPSQQLILSGLPIPVIMFARFHGNV